jgi:hypothetical protein
VGGIAPAAIQRRSESTAAGLQSTGDSPGFAPGIVPEFVLTHRSGEVLGLMIRELAGVSVLSTARGETQLSYIARGLDQFEWQRVQLPSVPGPK